MPQVHTATTTVLTILYIYMLYLSYVCQRVQAHNRSNVASADIAYD